MLHAVLARSTIERQTTTLLLVPSFDFGNLPNKINKHNQFTVTFSHGGTSKYIEPTHTYTFRMCVRFCVREFLALACILFSINYIGYFVFEHVNLIFFRRCLLSEFPPTSSHRSHALFTDLYVHIPCGRFNNHLPPSSPLWACVSCCFCLNTPHPGHTTHPHPSGHAAFRS